MDITLYLQEAAMGSRRVSILGIGAHSPTTPVGCCVMTVVTRLSCPRSTVEALSRNQHDLCQVGLHSTGPWAHVQFTTATTAFQAVSPQPTASYLGDETVRANPELG